VRNAAPIIKWVGGKTKLLPELQARMPKSYKRYFEPFLGGASLFLALAPSEAVLGDMNGALIETYTMVAWHVEDVINKLDVMKTRYLETPKDYYYQIREWWNDGVYEDDACGRAAAFIFLNKTCFNGLWRVNKSDQFNVPMGDYKNPTIYDADAMRAAGKVFGAKKVSLRIAPYDLTTASATAEDFVYFDPPYDPHSKTSNFTSYTKDTFGKREQELLANHARELRKRGTKVMLSNNDTPYIRELYADFCIDNVKCGRAINSKGGKRGKVDEVIITSYERTS
jgi:DNA adenine methylase